MKVRVQFGSVSLRVRVRFGSMITGPVCGFGSVGTILGFVRFGSAQLKHKVRDRCVQFGLGSTTISGVARNFP